MRLPPACQSLLIFRGPVSEVLAIEAFDGLWCEPEVRSVDSGTKESVVFRILARYSLSAAEAIGMRATDYR